MCNRFIIIANLILHGLDNPDYTISSSTFDVDTVTDNRIYRLDGPDLTSSMRANALNSIPQSAVQSAKSFLIQQKFTDYYFMQILILYYVPNNIDITWSFRCIGTGSNTYKDTFKRVLQDATDSIKKVSGVTAIAKATDLSTLKTPGTYYSVNGLTNTSLPSAISVPVYLFVLPYSSGATLQVLMGGNIFNNGGFILTKFLMIFLSITIAWRDLLRDITKLNSVAAKNG